MLTYIAVLQMMLTVGPPPGQTLYSDVESPQDARPVVLDGGTYRQLDAGEPEPSQCTQPGNVACRRPRFDADLNKWLITETWEQGLGRYVEIAEAIAEAAGDNRELGRHLVVVSLHESGWWRTVQMGWNHRPHRRTTKFEDSGRSHGIYQIMCGRSGMTPIPIKGYRDHDCRELWGPGSLGFASRVAATRIGDHLRMCQKRGAGATCVYRAYAGTGISATHPYIRARAASWLKLRKLKALPKRVTRALGLGKAGAQRAPGKSA